MSMLSVVIQALKKSVTFRKSLLFDIQDWTFEITLHSSSARLDSPCADSPDRDSGFT